MTSPMLPYEGDVNDMYGQDPIDPNPNVDASAGYGNAVPPPPGPGSGEVATAPYAAMNFRAQGKRIRDLLPSMPAGLSMNMSSALHGLAGAAALSLFGKKRSFGSGLAMKGAAGGVLACFVGKRVTEKLHCPPACCTMVAVVGGYLLAKFWK